MRRLENLTGLGLLITKAKAGSKSALGQALHVCRPRLLRLARSRNGIRTAQQASASDIVQDTFVYASKGFAQFRGQHGGAFVRWLCTILANRLVEVARRSSARRTAREVQGDSQIFGGYDCFAISEHATPSAIVADREISRLISQALVQMSHRDQQVLKLRFEEQLKFPQIGDRLGLREDAARMLFNRAIRRLRPKTARRRPSTRVVRTTNATPTPAKPSSTSP